MGAALNLSGQVFGRLTVQYRKGKTKCGNYTWTCLCECGQSTVVPGGRLRNGHTRSCGCLSLEKRFGKDHPGWMGGYKTRGSVSYFHQRLTVLARTARIQGFAAPAITDNELVTLYADHDKLCDLCRVSEDKLTRGLYIDHCHKTGRFRGFLCTKCNIALAMLGDSFESLQRAAHYAKGYE